MPVKILSVDDNKTICFIIGRALKPYDCTVYEAANGEEGLATAAREKPDLIILDINMPVMDGIAMLTRLRETEELSRIPVIMLTAWSGQENVLQVAKLGVQGYLVKPFTKDQLLERVGRVVSLQRNTEAGAPGAAPTSAGPANDLTKTRAATPYGLEPMPESVALLAALVTQQDVDLDEIAKIITRDKVLTARLLRAANPPGAREEDREITTAEQALLRMGLGCVFLLTMGELIIRALVKTFQTMLAIKLEPVSSEAFNPGINPYILGEVKFSGKAFGKVQLRLEQESARVIAERMLGLDAKEQTRAGRIDDAICELTSMVAGTFLSNLADAGLQSNLTPPKVRRTTDLYVGAISGAIAERFSFRSAGIFVALDITVDPWHG